MTIRSILFLILFTLLIPLQGAYAADLTWASKAVVKLFSTQQSWNVSQPWSKSRARQGTCSGFFIKQGILTNAHCVADATYIEMEIPEVEEKIEVRAVAINHQIDLALLQPVNPNLALNISVIEFGSLPDLREKVVTVGYPSGGRQVSYTEGVVSRIDVMRYIHSNILAPLVQTDAPINPGNSGGPVFSDKTGACLGVSTQKSTTAEGMGFFIPTAIIQQFLLDIEDGEVHGVPALSAFFQSLENPAARAQLKLNDTQSGIRIRDIAHNGSLDGILQADDVLLEIDHHKILNDGRVPFQKTGRIWLAYHVAKRQVGDILPLKISRNGEVKEINVKLKPYRLTLIPRQPLYDQQTPYLVSGGLLFIAVEQRYLWNWGRKWVEKVPSGLKNYLNTIYGYDDLEQLVIISEVFDASVNKGYSGEIENIRVLKVNNEKISRLSDIENAIQKNKQDFHLFELEGNIRIVLNRAAVDAQEKEIRKRYGINGTD